MLELKITPSLNIPHFFLEIRNDKFCIKVCILYIENYENIKLQMCEQINRKEQRTFELFFEKMQTFEVQRKK